MASNLAHQQSSDDDSSDFRNRPRRHLTVVPSARQNSTPQGYQPHSEYGGEDEIIVDAGIWVVFNRRLLSLIKRRQ